MPPPAVRKLGSLAANIAARVHLMHYSCAGHPANSCTHVATPCDTLTYLLDGAAAAGGVAAVPSGVDVLVLALAAAGGGVESALQEMAAASATMRHGRPRGPWRAAVAAICHSCATAQARSSKNSHLGSDTM